MRDFMKKAARYAAFLGLFFLLNAGLGNAFIAAMPDRAGARSHLSQVFAEGHTPHVLVVGDSHPMCAVDPSRVTGLVNAAWIGQRYDISYNLLERVFRRRPGEVEIVVLPLERHSFARDRFLQPLRDPSSRRFEDTLYIGWRTGLFEEQAYALMRYEIFPYLGAVDVLLDPSNPCEKLRDYERHYPNGLADNADAQGLAEVTAQLHAASGVWWEEVLADYFVAILDKCRHEHVQAVVVSYPVSTPYWEAIQALVPLAPWRERVAALLKAYPEVPVLDYARFAQDRPSFFIDSDHVNPRYAGEFTEKLHRDLMAVHNPPGRGAGK